MTYAFFPLDQNKVKWSSKMVQAWDVTEETTVSGRRRALCQQVYPSCEIQVTFPRLSKAEVNTLVSFYSLRKGTFEPWYYKDAEYYQGEHLAKLSDTQYQCMEWTDNYLLPAQYVDNVKVYVGGTQVTTGFTTSEGKIVFASAPTGTVTANYEYWYKVVFANKLSVTQKFKDYFEVGLTLKVVRE